MQLYKYGKIRLDCKLDNANNFHEMVISIVLKLIDIITTRLATSCPLKASIKNFSCQQHVQNKKGKGSIAHTLHNKNLKAASQNTYLVGRKMDQCILS